MGADINNPKEITPIFPSKKTSEQFPNIPENKFNDINNTSSEELEKLKKSYINLNITQGDFGNLKIDTTKSDTKLTNIPDIIPNGNNINHKEYITKGKINLEFYGDSKILEIPYSVIRTSENQLKIIFLNKDNIGNTIGSKKIIINKEDSFKNFEINFDNFYSSNLGNKKLNLELNIDWK